MCACGDSQAHIFEFGVFYWDYMHRMPWSMYLLLSQILMGLDVLNNTSHTNDMSRTDNTPDSGANAKKAKEKSGKSLQLGIDRYFLDKAGEKNIIELEGVFSQIEIISSLSMEIQEELLSSVLDNIGRILFDDEVIDEEDTISSQDILTMWKYGDTTMFESMRAHDEQDEENSFFTEFIEKMFKNRDAIMAEKIVEYINHPENGDYFVVVGLGHLAGNDSIVERLMNSGYIVEEVL